MLKISTTVLYNGTGNDENSYSDNFKSEVL